MTMRRLATSNLFNLAPADFDYYPDKRYDERTYQRKVRWLAQHFAALDSDVIGVQEVFSLDSLRTVVEEARDIDGRQVYGNARIIAEGFGHSKPAVGLITKMAVVEEPEYIPMFPEDSIIHDDFDRFSRPILKVGLRLAQDETLTVFVTHLKSKRGMFLEDEDPSNPLHQTLASVRSLMRRGCEAAALRSLVVRELAREDGNRAVMVMGDLNDATYAVTTVAVGGQTYMGYLPDEEHRQRKRRIIKSWESRLYSAWELQLRKALRDVYYTHIHDSVHESLDHIFVSEEFHKDNPHHRWYVECTEVFNDQLGATGRTKKWVTDHGTVRVTVKKRR